MAAEDRNYPQKENRPKDPGDGGAAEIGQTIRETGEQIGDSVELTGMIREKVKETQKSLQQMLGEGTYKAFHKIK